MASFRLHPLTLLVNWFQLGGVYIPLVLCLYALDLPSPVVLGVSAAALVQGARVYGYVRSCRLRVTATDVTFSYGRWVRRARRVPLDAVVEVHILRPFPARLLGLAAVTVDTRHRDESPLTLRYLGASAVERLHGLLSRPAGAGRPAAPPVFHHHFTPYQLFLSGFTSHASFVLWLGLAFLLTQAAQETAASDRRVYYVLLGRSLAERLTEPLPAVVAAGCAWLVLALFCAAFFSGLWYVLRLYPMTVTLTADGVLSRRYGWLKTHRLQLARESLQLLVADRNPLLWVTGQWRLRVVALAGEDASPDRIAHFGLLCPVITEDELRRLWRRLTGVDPLSAPYTSLPATWRWYYWCVGGAVWFGWSLAMDLLLDCRLFVPAALGLSPVLGLWVHRVQVRSGFHAGRHGFILRHGWLAPRIVAVPWERVTTCTVLSSPLQRWLGCGTVRLDTAAQVELCVRHLSPALQRRLLTRTLAAARRVAVGK